MSIIDKYNAALDSKRNGLAAFASNGIDKISLPSQTPDVQTVNNPSGNGKAATALMVGGAVILIGGIALSKDLVGVLGGIALAGGIAMKVVGGKTASTASIPNEPKYYQITNRLYAQLSDIQKHLFNEWKQTVDDNKYKLKNEIQSLDIDSEQKNAAIQAVLSTSILDIPMMTVSSELSDVEKQKSIDAYRQYLQTFKSRCLTAIDKAVSGQKAIYARMGETIEGLYHNNTRMK